VSDLPAIPLDALGAGAVARFHEARLSPETREMLDSLGLTDSCELRLCKAGEPLIVQVKTTRIGLSRAVAHGIYVIPRATDAA
jgi:Fe2+ transport system protein FeoA